MRRSRTSSPTPRVSIVSNGERSTISYVDVERQDRGPRCRRGRSRAPSASGRWCRSEKKSACARRSRPATRHARGSSIIVPIADVLAGSSPPRRRRARPARASARARARRRRAGPSSRRAAPAGALAHRPRGAEDRAHLHLVDLRVQEPEPARRACRASGWSPSSARTRSSTCSSSATSPSPRSAPRSSCSTTLVAVGQELVQRRVEQADRDRQARPSPRRCPRSRACCSGSSSSSAARRSASSSAMIIARIFGWRSAAMNMCSVRQRPTPSAPNSRARRASSGVSAFARTPSVRSSSHQPSTVSKCSVDLRRDERHVVAW